MAERLDQLAADRVLVAGIGGLVRSLAPLERVGRRRAVFDLLRSRDAALVALWGEGRELGGGGGVVRRSFGGCIRTLVVGGGKSFAINGRLLRFASGGGR